MVLWYQLLVKSNWEGWSPTGENSLKVYQKGKRSNGQLTKDKHQREYITKKYLRATYKSSWPILMLYNFILTAYTRSSYREKEQSFKEWKIEITEKGSPNDLFSTTAINVNWTAEREQGRARGLWEGLHKGYIRAAYLPHLAWNSAYIIRNMELWYLRKSKRRTRFCLYSKIS